MPIADVVELLTCPVCAGRDPEADVGLVLEARTLRCPAGHAYDLARQGYVNLTGQAEPRHADTAAMVAARERLLGSGAYDPLAAALLAAVRGSAPASPTVVLEAGAGPGWYLARLLDHLGPDVRGVSLDVSVAASRRAAQVFGPASGHRGGAVVADVWARLPVRTGVVDVVLSVFAPRHAAEFARVLRPGGVLVVASPLPDHLAAVRAELGLLQIEPGKQERLEQVLGSHLEPVATTDVRFDAGPGGRPTDDLLADLVGMGPNAFHTSAAELEARTRGTRLPGRLQAAVQVGVWRRPVLEARGAAQAG